MKLHVSLAIIIYLSLCFLNDSAKSQSPYFGGHGMSKEEYSKAVRRGPGDGLKTGNHENKPQSEWTKQDYLNYKKKPVSEWTKEDYDEWDAWYEQSFYYDYNYF